MQFQSQQRTERGTHDEPMAILQGLVPRPVGKKRFWQAELAKRLTVHFEGAAAADSEKRQKSWLWAVPPDARTAADRRPNRGQELPVGGLSKILGLGPRCPLMPRLSVGGPSQTPGPQPRCPLTAQLPRRRWAPSQQAT